MNKETKKLEEDLKDISYDFLQIIKGLISEIEVLKLKVKRLQNEFKKARNRS